MSGGGLGSRFSSGTGPDRIPVFLVTDGAVAYFCTISYYSTFDQASPNLIPVGSQADLSDLKIKQQKDDFATDE